MVHNGPMSTAATLRYGAAIREIQANLEGKFDVAALVQRWQGGKFAVTIIFQDYTRALWADTVAEAKEMFEEEAYWASEAERESRNVYCGICDGLGHSICPLEERGYWDARQDEERYGGWF